MKRKEEPGALHRGSNAAEERAAALERANTRLAEEIAQRRHAEEALRDSELRFRTLAETTSAAILLYGEDDHILYASPATTAITGFSNEELLGKTLWELVHPDSRASILARRESRGRGEPVSTRARLRFVTKSGEERWADYSAGFADIGGRRTAIGTAFDVTEQKRNEETIRRERDLSEAILKSLPGVFYLYDENLRFIYWNENFERVLGYTSEEIAELSPLALFEGPDRQLLAERIQEVFTKGASDVEADFVTKDGRHIPHFFTGHATRIDDRLCLIGMGVDITQRKLAEEALRTTRRRLEEAQARAHLGSWEIDPVRRQGYWSAEMYRLYERDPELGPTRFREFAELTHPEDRDKVNAAYARAIESGEPATIEYRAVLPSGRVRHLSGMVDCVRDEQGRVIRLAGTLLDVTQRCAAEEERQRLQAALRRSEIIAAMGVLVGGVAHEVRNPIFGMTATLDAMEARLGERREIQPFVGVLRGELNRLGELMRDLLEYGTPYALSLSPGPLGEVVLEAADACRMRAESDGVTIAVDVRGDLLVPMDRARLRQVFENLLCNAIQLSPKGGVVTVATERSEADPARPAVCSVSDRGPGFREEDLHSVFDPFFSRRRGGTGLGLSIVQRIVEEHGGTVSAANRPEGGAVLTVRLPVEAR